MVALLTGTSHGKLDTARMPGTDTGDLSETLVRLSGQLLGVPTRGDTLESLALGHTDDVDHLVLSKDAVDGDGLLKVSTGPVDLLRDSAAVHLDLHDVGFLLAFLHQAHLGVGNNAHNGAVLLDASQVHVDLPLAERISPLLGVLGEGLLLGLVPELWRRRKNENWDQGIASSHAR